MEYSHRDLPPLLAALSVPKPRLHRPPRPNPRRRRRRPRLLHPPVPRGTLVQPPRRHHRSRSASLSLSFSASSVKVIPFCSPVLWKITPRFAEWLAAPTNPLFASGVLGPDSSVLELGCGISPLIALALARRVGRYVLTDQAYVQRLVQRNLDENSALVSSPSSSASASKPSRSKKRAAAAAAATHTTPHSNPAPATISFTPSTGKPTP